MIKTYHGGADVMELTVTFILILSTVFIILLIRLITARLKPVCKRPLAELKIYYDSSCECLEYTLDRAYSSPALRDFELSVIIVDRVATAESRRWLNELRKKIKKDFYIISEEESVADSEHRDNKRDGRQHYISQ